MRCWAMRNTAYAVRIIGTINIISMGTNHINNITCIFEMHRHFLIKIVQHAHHTYCGCWVYRTIFTLVVKTHITTSNGCVEFGTSFTHAFDGVYKLIIHFGVVRISKIEAIGNTYWLATTAHNIAGSFAHGYHRPFVWVGKYITTVAIRSYC